MEELFAILKEQVRVLEKIGFCQTSYSEPKGMSFGMSWYHDILDIHFAIYWEKRDKFFFSCNVKEYKHYKAFHLVLKEYGIGFDIKSLYYQLNPAKPIFHTEVFTETLNYNLKKLRELIIVLE